MRILTINPGGTSTKIAVFDDDEEILNESIFHSAADLAPFQNVFDEYGYRMKMIMDLLEKDKISINTLSAVVGRGGLLKPIEGGTYMVNSFMVDDVKNAINGEHASNLGCVLAKSIADSVGVPAFVVDPVSVDEFMPESRITGLKDIEKASWLHALNQKAVARSVAEEMGKDYTDLNFLVAHLGSGISIAPHKKGKMIDGGGGRVDGPFSPERSGGLPTYPLIELCYSGKYTKDELVYKISNVGGMFDYLGTKNGIEIEKMYNDGDRKAVEVLNAFVLQVSKDIGSYSTVLEGDVDRIIITGGLAYSNKIVDMIRQKVSFIAQVEVVPGEKEMEALMLGARRVMNGQEEVKTYK
jgi:butyrate kinase